jgi:hypothetical protein
MNVVHRLGPICIQAALPSLRRFSDRIAQEMAELLAIISTLNNLFATCKEPLVKSCVGLIHVAMQSV